MQVPVCSPHPCPVLLPGWQRGRSAPLRSPGASTLQQGSAVSLLSLSQAVAAEWELWPMLNEGCAFEREDFPSVNYREHLQLLFKSQHCLSAPSSTGKLGCHPGRERGTHWWIPSSASAAGSPTALLGNSQESPGVLSTLRTWPRAALGFESWSPPAVMLPLIPGLKGPILQGTKHADPSNAAFSQWSCSCA